LASKWSWSNEFPKFASGVTHQPNRATGRNSDVEVLKMRPPNPTDKIASHLEVEMLKEYGPLLGGEMLIRVLGFPTAQAFRQARRRGSIGVATFAIQGRQGAFALTLEVARWLAVCATNCVTADRPDSGLGLSSASITQKVQSDG
jgi:hypothetical protein